MNTLTPKISLITSAISLVLLTGSSTIQAAGHEKQTTLIKCAGVVKAGLNDCASAEHACAGLNTDDGYESDWLWLPEGTCSKIVKAQILDENS